MKDENAESLTKGKIAEALRTRMGLSYRQSAALLESLLDSIICSLEEGHPVTIENLGDFEIELTNSRPGRNPMTGADAEIPSAVRAVFIIDQDLRARMAASLSVDDVEDEGEAD